ncbi:SDR family NAD(P)-dependent oxidoreductase [Aliihoeflea sp. PC F10.4]
MRTLLLEGKVAIVTGSGGGIGRAIALRLASLGANVVVNDLGVSVAGDNVRANVADAVVAEITSSGGKAVANYASIAQPRSANDLVEQAIESFGRLDIVVNNAGIIRMGDVREMSLDDWQAIMRTNLYGAVRLSRAAATIFKANGGGAFVHLSSASGLIGSTKQANYAAAKLGIAGLSLAIARDMARYGVRSNCLVPSSTSRMTDLTDGARAHLMSAEALEKLKAARAKSQPEHMAPVAAFLASDLAKDVNGQIVGARGSEIYLYSAPRPVRAMHSAEKWTPELVTQRMKDGAGPFLTPLEVITDVFNWTPS